MQCPYCRTDNDRVVDSRVIDEGSQIRRRRECIHCRRRFTTYERRLLPTRKVVKKDTRQESYDRQKILSGLRRACQKRGIEDSRLVEIVDCIEAELFDREDGPIATRRIGDMVRRHLLELDQVAYVRFSSVYDEYEDVEQFRREVENLGPGRSRTAPSSRNGSGGNGSGSGNGNGTEAISPARRGRVVVKSQD